MPPELEACLAVTRADPTQGQRLAAFLEKRPNQQITAALIPKISAEPWAKDLFARWEVSSVSTPVKRAIARAKEDGNV